MYFIFFYFLVSENDGSNVKLMYTLNKSEIDGAHKDKDHKAFSEDFKVIK